MFGFSKSAPWRLSCVSIFAICSFTSCQTEITPDIAAPPAKKARLSQVSQSDLAIGDLVDVFVMEDEKFNGSYKVRENGDIILPKLGRVHVAGMTVSGAQAAISTALQASQLAKATVIVDRTTRNTTQTFEEKPKMLVYVAGAVTHPGQHMIAIPDGAAVSAYEALLIAGGVSPFADERHAYILRREGGSNSRARIPLNIRDIRMGRGLDVPLREGDLITVPERSFGLGF